MSAPENPPVPSHAERILFTCDGAGKEAKLNAYHVLRAESEQALRAELEKAKADLVIALTSAATFHSEGLRQMAGWIEERKLKEAAEQEVAQLRESKRVMQLALQSAEAIFSELDSCSWPQSERDQFYGEPGQCPVNYDGAKADVSNALALTPETIAALAHPDTDKCAR